MSSDGAAAIWSAVIGKHCTPAQEQACTADILHASLQIASVIEQAGVLVPAPPGAAVGAPHSTRPCAFVLHV